MNFFKERLDSDGTRMTLIQKFISLSVENSMMFISFKKLVQGINPFFPSLKTSSIDLEVKTQLPLKSNAVN
jgi:hypothetical protein